MNNLLGMLVNQLYEVNSLQNIQITTQLIPANAEYVTIVTLYKLNNLESYTSRFRFGITKAIGPFKITKTTARGIDESSLRIGFLYHDGEYIKLVNEAGVHFTERISDITEADMYNESLWVKFNSGESYAFSKALPANLDKNIFANTRTFTSSAYVGGWYDEMIRLGVISKSRADANKKYTTIFIIIWAILFIGILIIPFILSGLFN